MLRKYHEDHFGLVRELSEKCQIIADIEQAVSVIDSASADTDALLYEANFLDVAGLWRMAQAPRLRVFAIRDRVFGVRNRRRFALSADGRSRSHGRFNRLQRRLDGSECWVDFLGRTESDLEEEPELPEDPHLEVEGESEDEEMRAHVEVQEGRFQAMNNWLLTLFTKWGRVLGGAAPSQSEVAVGGSHMPEKEGTGQDQNDIESDLDTAATERPALYRRSLSFGNGHFHRLSTVGEEDEPISMPNTPTNSGLPHISSGD